MATSKSIFVNSARQHDSFTDNGAVTHSTSLDSVLDFFFVAWTLIHRDPSEYLPLWNRAISEDFLLSMRCLFWMRDIRWWAWIRETFRNIYNSLPLEDQYHFLEYIPTYWRWDDVLSVYEKHPEIARDFIIEQFKNKDPNTFWLFCKWFPRKGKVFELVRKELGLTPKELRKIIVENTKVVEQKMSAKEWDNINYEAVPWKAFNMYKNAFEKHDSERFLNFVWEKPEKIKSSVLWPHELYNSWLRWDKELIIDEQRKNLPNYINNDESFLPIVDVSGSMYWLPIAVAISLWIYTSERNKSVFKDAFITFSNRPKMEYLKGTITQRFNQLSRAHWDMNTNVQASFDLILNTALENELHQSDLPKSVIIFSDMEFDECGWRQTNYELIKEKFAEAWYEAPKIIFWNLNWREGNLPVRYNEQWTALVSGFSPSLMTSLLWWEEISPLKIMMEVLNSDRYKNIK